MYSRRDCLEFHGIPESHGENTDELVKRVGELVGVEVGQTDISVSHRLPSKRGQIPTIIAKFTKRSTRDKIYQAKGNLKTHRTSDLQGRLKICILTKALLKEQKNCSTV
jgi:hypothetical protein